MGLIVFLLNTLFSFFISINLENKSVTRFILFFWLTLCGQVVLFCCLLSIFPLLTPFNFLVLSEFFLVTAYFLFRKKISSIKFEFNLKSKIHELTSDKLILVFVLGIAIIVIYNLIVALFLPSLNWDGASYHVPRIYHWLQNQQIGHYQTQEYRQNQFPINDSILMMWTHLISNNYLFINLIQWFSYLTAGAGIYLLGRTIKLKLNQAIFSTCLFFSLPMIVLQSSTVQNDLIVTSFMASFLFFLMEYLFKENRSSIIYAGIALGLGIGTKYTSVMLAPGILIMLIPILIQKKDHLWKLVSNIFLYCLLGIILFSSLNFVENYVDYQNPLGSGVESNIAISDSNPFSNSVRYFFQLVDFTGLQEPLASNIANKQLFIWKETYDLLNIKLGLYESNYLRISTYWNYSSPHEDYASYGLVGLILFLTSPFVFSKKNELANYLILIFWLWFVIFLIIFPHSPWRIRYLCVPMSIVCCASGVWYEENGKNILKKFFLILLIILSIYIGNFTTFNSNSKDLSVLFTTSRQEIYLDALPEEDKVALKVIKEIITPNSNYVTCFLPNSREFYYFNILDANEFVPDVNGPSLTAVNNQYKTNIDYYISNMGSVEGSSWLNIFDTRWSIMSKTISLEDNPFIEISEIKGSATANNLIRDIFNEIENLSKKQLEQIVEYSYTLNNVERYSLLENVYEPIGNNTFMANAIIPSEGIFSDHWTSNEFTIYFPNILFDKNPDYSMMVIEIDVSDRNKQMPILVTCNGKKLEIREGDGYFKVFINKDDVTDFSEVIPIDFKVNGFSPSDLDEGSIDTRELGWWIESVKYYLFTENEVIIDGIYSDNWTKGDFSLFLPVSLLSENTESSELGIKFDLNANNKQMPIQVTCNGEYLETKESDGFYLVKINKEDINTSKNVIAIDFIVNTFIPGELYENSTDIRELGWFINSIIYEFN